MSPLPQPHGTKPAIPNNLYTVILAMACGVVLATAAYVAFACYTQYGAIF
jgi:hypothetical protein